MSSGFNTKDEVTAICERYGGGGGVVKNARALYDMALEVAGLVQRIKDAGRGWGTKDAVKLVYDELFEATGRNELPGLCVRSRSKFSGRMDRVIRFRQGADVVNGNGKRAREDEEEYVREVDDAGFESDNDDEDASDEEEEGGGDGKAKKKGQAGCADDEGCVRLSEVFNLPQQGVGVSFSISDEARAPSRLMLGALSSGIARTVYKDRVARRRLVVGEGDALVPEGAEMQSDEYTCVGLRDGVVLHTRDLAMVVPTIRAL